MKTLIVYSSQTGNTQKLAEAVNDLLDGEKTLRPVSEAPDPSGYDLVALGFWLQAGKPDPKSVEYLTKVGSSKLFLFATHGAAADSAHAKNAMEQAKALAASAQIAGTFNCPGQANPAILEKAGKKNPPPPWLKDAPDADGHPDDADIERLKQTVKDTLSDFVKQDG